MTAGQPWGLNTRLVEAGFLVSLDAGRTGRRTSSPPQLGQWPCKRVSAQSAQKVHSKEQMRASSAAGGRSRLQHSQLGRSWSMVLSCGVLEAGQASIHVHDTRKAIGQNQLGADAADDEALHAAHGCFFVTFTVLAVPQTPCACGAQAKMKCTR